MDFALLALTEARVTDPFLKCLYERQAGQISVLLTRPFKMERCDAAISLFDSTPGPILLPLQWLIARIGLRPCK